MLLVGVCAALMHFPLTASADRLAEAFESSSIMKSWVNSIFPLLDSCFDISVNNTGKIWLSGGSISSKLSKNRTPHDMQETRIGILSKVHHGPFLLLS